MTRRKKHNKKAYRCTTANYEVSEGFMAGRRKRITVVEDDNDDHFQVKSGITTGFATGGGPSGLMSHHRQSVNEDDMGCVNIQTSSGMEKMNQRPIQRQ